jgi:hypothetical protein
MPHFYWLHIGNGAAVGGQLTGCAGARDRGKLMRLCFTTCAATLAIGCLTFDAFNASWRRASATWRRRAALVREVLSGRPITEWPHLLRALRAAKLAARRERDAARNTKALDMRQGND